MNTVDQFSSWLNQHQLLVVSVLIPLISAIVAALSSWYATHRALKTERVKMAFEGTIKVAEFRQAWINNLREAMSEFQSYGVVPDLDPSRERKFYELGTKVELLMNPRGPDYKCLSDSLYDFLVSSDGDRIEKLRNNAEYVGVCQRILKREWDRRKSDIRGAEGSDD